MRKIVSKYGELIPKDSYEKPRDKYKQSVVYYDSGALKSVYLEEPIQVSTCIGTINAELITFYEDQNIKRVFPLYGQVSGYWTEEEEYKLAVPVSVVYNQIKATVKVLTVSLYHNGALRSITLWKGEHFDVTLPCGHIYARLGASFYESGELKSIEPEKGTLVSTAIGAIEAYDNNPIGINADNNSLVFYKNGEVKSVLTIKTGIIIRDKIGGEYTIKATKRRSLLSYDQYEYVPLQIMFTNEGIEVKDSKGNIVSYSYQLHSIETFQNKVINNEMTCTACEQCGLCKQPIKRTSQL